jgi:DNA polymerase-3 subunit chi
VIADTPDADPADGDLVVNLASGTPPDLASWARVAEVVDSDAGRRQRGRERFRAYRERGIEPATHEMRSEP